MASLVRDDKVHPPSDCQESLQAVWGRQEKPAGERRAAGGFETSAVATPGCQKICLIETIRGGSPASPGDPAHGCLSSLEDEGFLKARAPCAADSVSSSSSVLNWPFPVRD